ncbi:MAG TPA: hypothetical protein VD968_01920 [Pyrinomonadaceae bacterium]|nr:hypothetical protein [Pyrinomonadaceae bacterium]
MLTSGDKSNRLYVGDDVEIGPSVSRELASLLFDPQTAGGLLVSIEPGRAAEFVSRLRESYPAASVIGRVRERGPRLLVVE